MQWGTMAYDSSGGWQMVRRIAPVTGTWILAAEMAAASQVAGWSTNIKWYAPLHQSPTPPVATPDCMTLRDSCTPGKWASRSRTVPALIIRTTTISCCPIYSVLGSSIGWPAESSRLLLGSSMPSQRELAGKQLLNRREIIFMRSGYCARQTLPLCHS